MEGYTHTFDICFMVICEEPTFEPVEFVENDLEWSLQLFKEEIDGEPWLVATLDGGANESPLWQADIRAKFCLETSRSGGSSVKIEVHQSVNSTANWRANIVRWDDLIDPAKCFFVHEKAWLSVSWEISNVTGMRSARAFDFSVPSPMTDVMLSVEGRMLHVSKHILAAHSPHFEREFFGPETGWIDVMELNGVAHYEFVDLLEHVYPPGKPIEDMSCAHLLKLATRFDFPFVRSKIEDHLLGDEGDTWGSRWNAALAAIDSPDMVNEFTRKAEFKQLKPMTRLTILEKFLTPNPDFS